MFVCTINMSRSLAEEIREISLRLFFVVGGVPKFAIQQTPEIIVVMVLFSSDPKTLRMVNNEYGVRCDVVRRAVPQKRYLNLCTLAWI